MLGDIIKFTFGKIAGCVLHVIGVLFGVFWKDVQKLIEAEKLRDKREDYLQHCDEIYDALILGTGSVEEFHEKVRTDEYANLTRFEYRILDASDSEFANIRVYLIMQMVVDLMLSIVMLILSVASAVGGYLVWSKFNISEILELTGLD